MAWLDTPEEDRIVVLYMDGEIVAIGRPRHLTWMWGEYRLLLSHVKVPEGMSVVMVGFSEFDKITPGKMLMDRDRYPETGWTPTGEREFRR